VEKAEAVIILTDKFSQDAGKQDIETILHAMFIKKYLVKYQNNEHQTMLCMQLLRYVGITHYEISCTEETKDDQIVCIESLKLCLLAKSCLCPGLVVLITNLIKSSLNSKKIDDFLEEKKEDTNYKWLHEYWEGKKFEIYRIQIPSSYADRSFCEIANEIYKYDSLLLFALEIVVNKRDSTAKQKTSGDILLNPGKYKLPKPFSKNNKYTYYGYIIADDQKEAMAVFQKDQDNAKDNESKEL
jgi:hypothetical protein